MFRSNYVALSLILLTFTHLVLFSTVDAQKYSNVPEAEDIPRFVNALHEGLMYVKNHNETKTLDVALGVLLVKGSLQWIAEHLGQRFSLGRKYLTKIRELLELSKVIFSEIYGMFQFSENPRERKFSALLGFIFDGISAEDVKYGRLVGRVERVQRLIPGNCSFITDYILNGTPNDSDSCIIELFDKSCDISASCWFQETNQLYNAGYETSHRLLYLQLAMKLQCGKGGERRMTNMKRLTCQKMLQEARTLHEENMFFARDLFLEQIALCGFEGYAEFADRDWSTKILRWQRPPGCFGLLPGEQLPEEFCSSWKSDVNIIQDFCSAHLTAVAVSAIAFHLRVAFDRF